MAQIGLLGGSFNPAHRGHRRLSVHALAALRLDEVWWLVSPGNPLKAGRSDMAPLPARLRSARAMARRLPVRATAVEARLGTRFTVDTVRMLSRRYPRHRFIWLMGADIVAEFHRWRNWRRLASGVPIAVLRRPGYPGLAGAGRAAAWLRRFAHPSADAAHWARWDLPAVVQLDMPPDPTSSTVLRAANAHWARGGAGRTPSDPPIRRHIPLR